MQPSSESILAEALKLPDDEKMVIVSRLLEALPPEDLALSVDDPQFAEELQRRFADREGGIPWPELHAEG